MSSAGLQDLQSAGPLKGSSGTSGADGAGSPAGYASSIQYHATSGWAGVEHFTMTTTGSSATVNLTGTLNATDININGAAAAVEADIVALAIALG